MSARRTKLPDFKLGELLTVKELAEALHVSVKTVWDWTHKRRIPFTRIQRRVYFAVGAVNALLNANAVEPLDSSRRLGQSPWGQGGVGAEGAEHGES